MTVIRTFCTDCGADLEMGPKDFHLVVFDRGDRDYYEFICPRCTGLIRKPADEYVLKAMRIGRVPETRVQLPDEMFDARRDWELAISYDDLLDFALALRDVDPLAELQR